MRIRHGILEYKVKRYFPIFYSARNIGVTANSRSIQSLQRLITRSIMRDDIKPDESREGHDKRCRQETAARGLRIRTKENDTVCAAARKQNARSQLDTIHAKLQCSVRDIIHDLKDTIRYKYATINDTQYTISYNFYYTKRETVSPRFLRGTFSPTLPGAGQPHNDNL